MSTYHSRAQELKDLGFSYHRRAGAFVHLRTGMAVNKNRVIVAAASEPTWKILIAYLKERIK